MVFFVGVVGVNRGRVRVVGGGADVEDKCVSVCGAVGWVAGPERIVTSDVGVSRGSSGVVGDVALFRCPCAGRSRSCWHGRSVGIVGRGSSMVRRLTTRELA